MYRPKFKFQHSTDINLYLQAAHMSHTKIHSGAFSETLLKTDNNHLTHRGKLLHTFHIFVH